MPSGFNGMEIGNGPCGTRVIPSGFNEIKGNGPLGTSLGLQASNGRNIDGGPTSGTWTPLCSV